MFFFYVFMFLNFHVKALFYAQKYLEQLEKYQVSKEGRGRKSVRSCVVRRNYP